jgi:hypothetical protein
MSYARTTAIALAAALVTASSASAASRSDARSSGCASKMTFLIWPHGHPAIPAVGFADMTTPHVEIYKAGNGYANAQFLAWAAAGKTPEPSPSTAPACLSFASIPNALKPLGTMSVIARTTAVSCTFPSSASIDIQRMSGGKFRYRVRVVLAGGRLAAETDVTPAGVKLHYPAKLCRIVSPPAP